MPVAVSPWNLRRILCERPTVGRLLDLCEENYWLLLKLAPTLRILEGRQSSGLGDGVDLYLDALEQTPYSSLIRLTHRFHHQGQYSTDPAALLRVYYDARQVEVVSLGAGSAARHPVAAHLLDRKWRLNLFLSKWLSYCVSLGHRFGVGPATDLQVLGSRRERCAAAGPRADFGGAHSSP